MTYCVRQVFLCVLEEQFILMLVDDFCNDIVMGASTIDDILDDDDNVSPIQILNSINNCNSDGCSNLIVYMNKPQISFLVNKLSMLF